MQKKSRIVKRRGARMPAAFLTSLRRIEVGDAPVPSPTAGEVLIEMQAVGICGSDLHYFHIGRIGSQRIKFPVILGHEPAGVVAALGKGVKDFQEGERVAVEPAMPCEKCRMCRKGRANLCYQMRFLGTPEVAGAFTRYIVMPARCVERLPSQVDAALGSAAEPLGVAHHAIGLIGAKKADCAAIIGGGPIGLCVAALLQAQRTRVVVLSDPRAIRRTIARRLGVARAVEPGDFVDAARKSTSGFGVDCVFECSGAPEAYDQAIGACCRGGRVAIVGINEVDHVSIEPHEWRRRELTVIQVRRSNHSLPAVLRLAAGGKLGLREAGFFSKAVGLGGMQEAFERLDDRASNEVKIVVDPRSPL